MARRNGKVRAILCNEICPEDRSGWRDDRRGYGRDDTRGDWRNDRRSGVDGGRRQQDPMAGMSLDERKRAIKNEREAQKKAIKRGIFIQ